MEQRNQDYRTIFSEEPVFNDSRYREVSGLLILLFSIIILLSLISYSIGDYVLLSKSQSVKNIIGPVGAAISSFLRTAFGYSSYFIFVIMVISGWSVIKKGSIINEIERIFSISYLLITTSSLISLIFKDTVPQFSGGLIGLYLSGLFEKFSGQVGAYLLLIILNIAGLILLGSVSISILLDDLKWERFKPIHRIKSILKRLAIKKREKPPLTHIDIEIDTGNKKKPPWIIKKRISIGDEDESVEDDFRMDSPKLLGLDDTYEVNDMTSFNFEGVDDAEPLDIYNPEADRGSISDYSEGADFPVLEHKGNDKVDSEGEAFSDFEFVLDGIEVNRIKSIERENSVNKPIMADGDLIVEEYVKNDNENIPGDLQDSGVSTEIQNGEVIGSERSDVSGNSMNGTKVFDEIDINSGYSVPTSFLQSSSSSDFESWKSEIKRNSELLVSTLEDFGIESRVTKVNRGPVITLYEMQIAPGIKVNRIVGLSDDIAMALAASRVRVVAPIPGKSAIGVEIPNRSREIVTLGDVIKSKEYQDQHGMLKVALGKDILGKPVMLDLKRLPHLLIAGATGSGKSVLVNTIITSLTYNYDPNYVRFILVDPKMVELQIYNGLPHLLTPVITEPHVAPKALKWALFEMERRYKLLSELNTRDIDRYNQKVEECDGGFERLPYIIIIIDELADLMMVAAKEMEGLITRIAQKARAIGIHLVLATQRPSVDIITGVIKANFPARIAFQVAQKTDSRTIIDQNGAEKLLGKGDMLYQSPMSSFPTRIQGAFISEDEIMMVVHHLREIGQPSYIDIEENIFEEEMSDEESYMEDVLFVEAVKIIEETKKASASYLQRRLSIGYNRAARIIELMEERGHIGPQQGSKPRDVYI